VTADFPDLAGSRLTVMARVKSTTKDGRTVENEVAITSFIIGQDYDQSADLLIAPSETAVLHIVGPPVPIQILYAQFPV
jgi:hypothetical protein